MKSTAVQQQCRSSKTHLLEELDDLGRLLWGGERVGPVQPPLLQHLQSGEPRSAVDTKPWTLGQGSYLWPMQNLYPAPGKDEGLM